MQILPNDVKSTLLNCISDMASNCWQFTSQPSAFTRKRKISFEDVLLSVISMQKSSSRHEMLKYFDFNATNAHSFRADPATPSSYIQRF